MNHHPEAYTLTRDEWCLLSRALRGARFGLSRFKQRERYDRCSEALDVINEGYRRAASEVGESTSKWQPIETAPKDGTRIMLCKQVGYVMAWAGLGYWFNREPCPHNPPCKPGTHTGWTDGLDTYSTPTHWMPVIEVSTSVKGASSDGGDDV